MSLQQFPYELITQVISNLDGKDVLSFTQCNSYFYKRGQEESFWHDLCNLNGIHYCHPDITWKQLYCSDKLSKMCPHISHAILNPSILEQKKRLLWNSFSSVANGCDSASKNYILCLHPSCNYFGDLACHLHHDNTKHNIVLKLSTMHCLELWCNSCLKTIGFDGFATNIHLGLKSERYVMNRVTRTVTSVSNLTNSNNNNNNNESDAFVSCIIQGRRKIEASIYKNQFRYPAMHIVDKNWHSSWLDFISGSSSVIPGVLTNEKLLRSDGSLDPKLSLGKDFELIGSLTRWYIERIYGVSGVIISSVGLDQIPEYCKLAHSIRIRQHMSQVANFPPAF